MSCCATKPVAAMANQTTSSFQAGDPMPPATAAGTRPIIRLVATTNVTGSTPSRRFTTSSAAQQTATRRREQCHDPQVAAQDLRDAVRHSDRPPRTGSLASSAMVADCEPPNALAGRT